MVIEVKPEQPEKAELPIEVTELGMVTDVRPEQLEKAELPMLVTLLGISIVPVAAEEQAIRFVFVLSLYTK